MDWIRFPAAVRWSLCLLPLVATLAGCGLQDAEELPELAVPDWVSDSAKSPAAAPIKLNLHAGDRFPLRKVIEKEVEQRLPTGQSQIHKLRIELTLGMTVEAVSDRGTKFRVRYERVRYTHQDPESYVEYDSALPQQAPPLSMRAWQAMVGDGFAFQVGRDNQIASVEGFQEFLQRCLSVIPPDRQEEVMLSIESSSGENGVSDFVDNAIGLLPTGEQKPGDVWERARHIGRPVPMQLHNTYTLKELSDNLAVIQISGRITPSTTLMDTPQASARRVRMVVREGTAWGACSIYRDTGLPQKSRVEHDILMTVYTSGGATFDQHVRGATTIESFPVASGATPTIIGVQPQQAQSAQQPTRTANSPFFPLAR